MDRTTDSGAAEASWPPWHGEHRGRAVGVAAVGMPETRALPDERHWVWTGGDAVGHPHPEATAKQNLHQLLLDSDDFSSGDKVANRPSPVRTSVRQLADPVPKEMGRSQVSGCMDRDVGTGQGHPRVHERMPEVGAPEAASASS